MLENMTLKFLENVNLKLITKRKKAELCIGGHTLTIVLGNCRSMRVISFMGQVQDRTIKIRALGTYSRANYFLDVISLFKYLAKSRVLTGP